MGMYTELVLGVELNATKEVLQKLKFMLGTSGRDVNIKHPLFSCKNNTPTRWSSMLISGSYYFDGQTDSKLFHDNICGGDYLNVRCNLKNYDNEIKLFLDWLCPYIATEGFLGYTRYEENYNPTLIYKENNEIVYKDWR